MKNTIVKLVNHVIRFLDLRLAAAIKPDLSAYPISSRPSKPKYLNVGAGMWSHPLWHNIDNPSPGYGKSFGFKENFDLLIKHDLMSDQPIPVDDNSIRCIFTSHTVEHLDDTAVRGLFEEAHRVLEVNGVFRIVCPDINIFINSYFRKDLDYLVKTSQKKADFSQSMEQMLIAQFGSALSDLVIDCGVQKIGSREFRQNVTKKNIYRSMDEYLKQIPREIVRKFPRNHDSWWTESKMIALLNECGFENAYPTRFGQSHAPEMRDIKYFDTTHVQESLYVEAVKT